MNPPYGLRLGEEREVEQLYRMLPEVLRRLPTWSHYLLTARGDLEQLVGQKADRRRKLFNAQIECTYYQFYGPRPPRGYVAPVVVASAVVEAAAPADQETTSSTIVEVAPPAEQPVALPPPQPPPRAFGGLRAEAKRQADEFANRLHKLARHLRRWPTKRGITCYRLYERDIPEIPLVVDRYENALHIAEFERPHDRDRRRARRLA